MSSPYPSAMNERDGDVELKKELNAAVQARKDLGEDYESALVDSFLEKLDARVDNQVERRVRRQLAERTLDAHRPDSGSGDRSKGFAALPYVSMVLAVPLSAIGAVNEGLSGLLVSWTGILGVNVAAAWVQRGGPVWRRRSED